MNKQNMKAIKISKYKKHKNFNKNYIFWLYKIILQKSHSILISINFMLTIYLLIKNKRADNLVQKLVLSKKNIPEKSVIDKDMIGLTYPEIQYNKIKKDYNDGKILSSINEFLTQLETKLIFLEKEINVTKVNSFYTTRNLFLKRKNVEYDDAKISQFHEIVSWLVIHKSTQLKGIASDKYLGCKYVEIKLGKKMCQQRIAAYNSVEEIDFNKLVNTEEDLIVKISNGCHDSVHISPKNSKQNIEKIKESITFFFNRDYSFVVPEFFHLYSKKRIVVEKKFTPFSDLYEFKFMILNHEIKMVYICFSRNNRYSETYFDENYNPLKSNHDLDISIFKKSILDELKTLAIKLSEDFPNFIRVDLYLFHDTIYLSELTFDSHSGIPVFTDIKHFNDGVKKWKRIDY